MSSDGKGRPVSKPSVKLLMERYAKGESKFTPEQFTNLLKCLIRKRDGTVSATTVKNLAPLFSELSQGRMPHVGLVLVALEKLNQPFFRRKKKPAEGKDEVHEVSRPGTVVKKSNFVSAPVKPSQGQEVARLKQKLTEQWREKVANSYKEGGRTDHIKSVGNGL